MSARSKLALDRAIQLAAQHQAKLTALHVVHEDIPGQLFNDLLEERRSGLQTELRVAQSGRGVQAEVATAWGDVLFEVVQFVERHPIDLVILGVREKKPLRDAFLGTTAARITRNIKAPSLFV